MLGLLCPECSIVKISPPLHLVHAFVFVYFAKQLQLLGIFAARQMFWVDIVSFSLVKHLYFYLVTPTFVLHTLMCLKSIGRPFTVEHLPWKKRDILLGLCLENMTAQDNIKYYLRSTPCKLTKCGYLYSTVMYSKLKSHF